VVGLGNPGPDYAPTRHNVGARVVDVLAARSAVRLSSHRSARADVAEVRVGPLPGVRAVLARPRTYMNTSGGPVAGLVGYYGVPLDRVVVVHDELDLPLGAIRLKQGGGDNGHNGLRSLRQSLGSGDFHRVRLGIGRPPGRQDPADFVLRSFASGERDEVEVAVERAADAAETLLLDGLDRAQNLYNS
jgi:PTH1 family peptidyl-tRNA hydrolase